MKTGRRSLRTDAATEAGLVALKRAHVGKNDADRFRLGIKCCCLHHGIKVAEA
ncbi:TPA_asm: hypothetical protein vir524_00046 [Caudoviricetes sp. vir524]|jgi:hypothetical protein|nr:TPA_asm: hypothetical protein vir524_00046 [Caudoviricetes sp. vir524]